jgi:endonuclease/exonuclease/phosphatase family metal-dependent hydrolase
MRVLTWNLWWQFGPWRERLPVITDELRAVDPDIAFLQEVWVDSDTGNDQAHLLAEALGHHLVRSRRSTGEPQRFGNAILSRWPVEELETILLPGPDDQPSHRTALAARVSAPGRPWTVVVTHLAWQYDQSALRQTQLEEVVALVARHGTSGGGGGSGAGPSSGAAPSSGAGPLSGGSEAGGDEVVAPTILAGDFNAVPEADEIRRLTGLAPPYVEGLVFTDCWAAVGDGPGHTWTRENPHSAEASWPRRRLDYVFVSWPRPRPFGNPLSARLVGVEPRNGTVGSDHYGVLVELCPDPPSPEGGARGPRGTEPSS